MYVAGMRRIHQLFPLLVLGALADAGATPPPNPPEPRDDGDEPLEPSAKGLAASATPEGRHAERWIKLLVGDPARPARAPGAPPPPEEQAKINRAQAKRARRAERHRIELEKAAARAKSRG